MTRRKRTLDAVLAESLDDPVAWLAVADRCEEAGDILQAANWRNRAECYPVLLACADEQLTRLAFNEPASFTASLCRFYIRLDFGIPAIRLDGTISQHIWVLAINNPDKPWRNPPALASYFWRLGKIPHDPVYRRRRFFQCADTCLAWLWSQRPDLMPGPGVATSYRHRDRVDHH